ncbi:9277_t:CDS:1, partial [Gigaspora margarita]
IGKVLEELEKEIKLMNQEKKTYTGNYRNRMISLETNITP